MIARRWLWLVLLCMVIVMTGALLWPQLETRSAPREQGTLAKGVTLTESRPSEQKPARNRVKDASAGQAMAPAAEVGAAAEERPVNRFQARLMEGAQLKETQKQPKTGLEPAREFRLWKTSFKHPLVREEQWLDEAGKVIRREFSVADHVMVRFPKEVSETEITTWAEAQGLHVRQILHTSGLHLIAKAGATLATADEILAMVKANFPATAAVVAERDYLVFPTVFPNDSSFSTLWGLHNTGQSGGTADADIDAPEAWDLTTGSRDVLVGIIDTGLDRSHPDLAANVWTNPREISGNGVDDDRNGYIDDVSGWDFFANDNNPMDEDDHGTHCAGTIGAAGNNASGVVGVNWQVSLVGLRFLGPSGGSTSDAIEAVSYATGLGVDLTSNSWGGGSSSSLLQSAIQAAGEANILFVAAAGNDGTNNDTIPHYPSNYTNANVISVASSTRTDSRSSFSNYGATSVDLAAPGSAILSTIPGGGYASFNGTSMAAPHVSGALALLKSVAPLMSAAEMKAKLLSTVDRVAAFNGLTTTGGRLNVGRLIEESAGAQPVMSAAQIVEAPGGNGDGIINPGEAFRILLTVTNRGLEPATNVQVQLSKTTAGTSRFDVTQSSLNLGTLAAGASVTPNNPLALTSSATGATPHSEDYTLTLSFGSPAQSRTQRVSLNLFTSSTISGLVTEVENGAVIPGAAVTYTGTTSGSISADSAGRYSFTVTDGSYQVKARAAGFVASAEVPVTVPPSRANLDFALGVPRLQLTPPELTVGLHSGDQTERIVMVGNRGTVPLTWNLKIQRTAAATQKLTPLPSVSLPVQSVDSVIQTSGTHKTTQIREASALNVQLGSLTGIRVGVVENSWDRSVILNDLTARGATIETLRMPFTASALNAVQVIVIDDQIYSASSLDIELLRSRVREGAGLLCEADDSASITKINQLFQDTGVVATYLGYRTLTLTHIVAHPITNGVTSLREVDVGAAASVSGAARALVYEPGGQVHAAITSLGSGSLFFIGNEILDSTNYNTGDGRLFANQIIDGLVGSSGWLTATPMTGTVNPGETLPVTFAFDATGLTDPRYDANAVFTSNDPDSPETEMALRLNVILTPVIRLSEPEIRFGNRVQGVAAQKSINITNTGSGPLNVSPPVLRGEDAAAFRYNPATAFTVAVGQQRTLTVDFIQDEIGEYEAELVLSSDDLRNPEVVVPIHAARTLAPDIVLTPAAVTSVVLRQGAKTTRNFVILNRGKGPLDWQVTTPTMPSWLKLPVTSGTVAPGARYTLQVHFDASAEPVGVFAPLVLALTTQDPQTPILNRTLKLQVTAAPQPVLTPTAISFPATFVKGQSRRSFTVRNAGAAPLALSSAFSTNRTAFALVDRLPITVPAGGSVELFVDFKPQTLGTHRGSLTFPTTSVAGNVAVTLVGEATVAPKLTLTPASINVTMAPAAQASSTVTLSNTGGAPLQWLASVDQLDTLPSLLQRLDLMAGKIVELVPDAYAFKEGVSGTQIVTGGTIQGGRPLFNRGNQISTNLFGPVPYSNRRVLKHRAFGPAGSYFTLKHEAGLFAAVAELDGVSEFTIQGTLNTNHDRSTHEVTLSYEKEDKSYSAHVRSVEGGELPSAVQMIIYENRANVQAWVDSNSSSQFQKIQGLQNTKRVYYLLLSRRQGRDLSTDSLRFIFQAFIDSVVRPTWLTVNPPSGSTIAGESSAIHLSLNSSRLPAGNHQAAVIVQSDDPTKVSSRVPVNLKVTPATEIAFSPASLHSNEVWLGRFVDMTLILRSTGNTALKVESLISSSPELQIRGDIPSFVPAWTEVSIPVRLTPNHKGRFSAEIVCRSNASQNPVITVPVTADVFTPPSIAVSPSAIEVTLDPGVQETQTLRITNAGELPLNWNGVATRFSSSQGTGNLQDVLDSINTHQASLTALIPNLYNFSEGIVGNSINDGGGDMYDGGNMLGSNLSTSFIPYSDGVIGSHSALGTSGSYFTKKHPGLFVMAADLVGATRFSISGNLGADGGGSSSGGVFTRQVGGISYKGFFKRVYGASDPSVNHLIIVQDRPGLAHEFEANTDRDDHRVTGLSGATRLYYLLFATNSGGLVTDQTVTQLMDSFLENIARGSAPQWLALSQNSGSVGGASSLEMTARLSSQDLAPGSYSAVLRYTSNALVASTVEVPIRLTVNAKAKLRVTPGNLEFPETFIQASQQLPLVLRNVGNETLNISNVTSNHPTLSLPGTTFPINLAPNQERTLTIRFQPTTVEAITTSLTVQSNADGGSLTPVPVTARGIVGPTLALNPQSLTASVNPGTSVPTVFNVMNTGGANLTWNATLSAGSMNTWAQLSTTSGTTAGGASSPLTLTLNPGFNVLAGTYSGQIILYSNDPVNTAPRQIPLSITVTAKPNIAVNPSVVVFQDTFVGGHRQQSFQLQNTGNASLIISGITSNSSVFEMKATTYPQQIAPGGGVLLTAAFTPSSLGVASGSLTVSTNIASAPTLTIPLQGTGIAGPQMSVNPTRVDATLETPNASQHLLTITNSGGAPLNWTAQLVDVDDSGSGNAEGNLASVLTRLDSTHSQLTSLVPNLYLFTEGVTGNSILDGGGDMYDGGNMLYTSIDSNASIPYSDGVVTTHGSTGPGGRYFTRKHPGLFVFAADLDGASLFRIAGDLGADGAGNATGSIFTRSANGVTYKGFFKRVFGASDPSVNHLIIVEDQPSLARTFAGSTNSDLHEITGLSANTRLYYLLFASNNGGQISDSTATAIMDQFIQNVAVAPEAGWVSLTVPSGTAAAAGGTSATQVRLNSETLQPGNYQATVLLNSNATSGSIRVPISLAVTPRALEVIPRMIQASSLTGMVPPISRVEIMTQSGSNRAWTARTTASWLTLSVTSGTGNASLELSFASDRAVGSHTASVIVQSGALSFTIPVTLHVRAPTFTKLLTDYRRDRILGLVMDRSSGNSLLVALNPATLALQNSVILPRQITDMDITTDGLTLYAISFGDRNISQVDLETFSVQTTKPIAAVADSGTTAPYHYNIRAGRPGMVYYTDASSTPALHAYDFGSGRDVAASLLNGSRGIDEFEVTPDGNTLYARSQSGWSTTVQPNATVLARVSIAGESLSQTQVTSLIQTHDLLGHPVLFPLSREAVYSQDARFNAANLTAGPVRQFSGHRLLAASAYGDVVVSTQSVLNASSGAILKSFPAAVSLAAFSGDQVRLVGFNPNTQALFSLATSEWGGLPPAAFAPGIPVASVQPLDLSGLTWRADPLAASYDVFMGTDRAALEVATTSTPGLYLASTSGISLDFYPGQLQPGTTYYWRVDRLAPDGTRTSGSVWSFRVPGVITPTTSLTHQSVLGLGTQHQTSFSLSASSPTTEWQLSSDSPWVTLGQGTGTGNATVTVTLNLLNLPAGISQAIISLRSGGDIFSIPVSVSMIGTLNLVKLAADPNLPQIYALHRDEVAPFSSSLLWINPATAQITHSTYVGAQGIDFAIHGEDDRLYVLLENGLRVRAVRRQFTRESTATWTTSPAAEAIHRASVSNVLLRLPSGNSPNVVMLSGSNGSLISSLTTTNPCITTVNATGTRFFNASAAAISRWNISSTGLSNQSSLTLTSAAVGTTLIDSADSSRLFYRQMAYTTQTLGFASTIGENVIASSPTGEIAYTATQGLHAVTKEPLIQLSTPATAAAASADGGHLITYNSTTRALTHHNARRIYVSANASDFGEVLVGTSKTQSFNVSNLSDLDITLNFNSTNAAFSGPTTPVTLNRGQSAALAVTWIPLSTGPQTTTLTFSVAGQPSMTFTREVTGLAVTELNAQMLIDFEINPPGPGQQGGGANYSENGYSFTTPNSILRIGANYTNRPNNGTPHIAPLSGQLPLTITRGGAPFTLLRVDLAEYSYVFAAPKNIVWTGTKVGGSIVTATFRIDGQTDGTGPLADFETFTFPSTFTQLTSASVTVDVYAMDNIVLRNENGSTALTAQPTTQADTVYHAEPLDLDQDGQPDASSLKLLQTETQGAITTHWLSYTRKADLEDALFGIEASQDGESWISLTPDLDYKVESITPITDSQEERVRLRIESTSSATWRYRLTLRP